MDFFLFCLLNAVLFLRPAELVPALIGLPIYQGVLLASVAAAWPQMIKKLEPQNLLRNPINLCVLGVLVAVPLSHLRHFDTWYARHSFMDFGKTALYYLLFISVIQNDRRLGRFFKVVLVLIGFMTALSLLNRHQVIHLPQLDSIEQREIDEETGEVISYGRLQSTGIFNDPNDFSMILVIGIILAWQCVSDGNAVSRLVWLAFLAILVYALFLTKSRGGFLALFAACGFYSYSKWGLRRAAIIGVLMLPVVAAAFAMRNDGGIESGTGQSRMQLWAEGFGLWKNTLTYGIGYGMYAEEVGYVAHNSFLHTYVELGLFGGTMFFGMFFFGLRTLWYQREMPEIAEDKIASRRTTLAFGVLAAAAVSLLTISRAYGAPPYMAVGIGAVAAQLNGREVPFTLPQVDYPTARKLAFASAVFVVATYAFMKTFVNWG